MKQRKNYGVAVRRELVIDEIVVEDIDRGVRLKSTTKKKLLRTDTE